jgi:hypothetical protein
VIVDVSPGTLEATPGLPVVLLVTVTNTEAVIAAYELSVLGVDPDWVTIEDPRPSLFPDGMKVVAVTITLPTGVPAGMRRLAVQVREVTAPGGVETVPVEVDIPADVTTRIELDPPTVTAGKSATMGIILRNEGNQPEEVELSAVDEEDKVTFAFEPVLVRVEPGEEVVSSVELRARRPFTGSPKLRQFEVTATGAVSEPVVTRGVFVQKPVLSRGGLGLLGLLAAITVFAAVIATTFGAVVDRSKADRELLLDAIRAANSDGLSTTPGSVAGTVLQATTGLPLDGVVVDAFPLDDPSTSAGTTATTATGTYELEALPEGDYKLRFRGAGFTDVWFPEAIEPTTADPVTVVSGEATPGIDVRLGGIPASLAGTIAGDDPAGATVAVHLPMGTAQPLGARAPGQEAPPPEDPLAQPVVTSTVVDASGEFLLEGIPSPGTYSLVVSKEGFATEVQLVNLAPGEDRAGVEMRLRRGDGVISGTVLTEDGPLGGATITASDGRTTVTTSSLTRDQVGAFSLRSLPTPGTFTIVVSMDGYVTETLTVSLGVAEERSDLSVTLGSGAGSISGHTSIVGGGAAGGVRVRATDGESTFETVSVSVGDVGSYRLAGLPVPGTYTVTFERDDLTPQTRSIAVDAFGSLDVTGVDVSLVSSTGTVFGTVRDSGGVPVGNVDIVFSSSGSQFRTRSATSPAGAYEIRNLPPGTYAATFERTGSAPTALMVTVTAGGRHRVDAVLVARSAIRGIVTLDQPGFPPGAGVRVRLFLEDFPSTAIRTTTADANGFYEFVGLDAPAAYIVDFTPPPVTPASTATFSVNVVLQPGLDRNDVDATIPIS